jgi:RNA polymerase sigma factor (sigma-70 family)
MADLRISWSDVPKLWEDLRRLARRLLANEGQAQSVQTDDLILSALRRQKVGGWGTNFSDTEEVTWENRGEFFSRIHRAMRQALVDHARQRNRARRLRPVPLDQFDPTDFRRRAEDEPDLLEALGIALERLHGQREEWAKLVECIFWEDLSQIELAKMLDLSERTVRRQLSQVFVWIKDEINRILAEWDDGAIPNEVP